VVTVNAVRRAQARLLARPTVRTIRWGPFLFALPVAALALYAAQHSDRPPALANLPAAGSLLAAATGFVLDDPSAETTGSSPTPLVATRALRLAVALTPVTLCWAAAAWYADLGWIGVSLSAGYLAQVGVVLGLAAVGTLLVGRARAGLFAFGGLLVVFYVLPIAFDVALGLTPTATSWGHLYGRWLLVGGAGLAVFVLASSGAATRGALLPARQVTRRPAEVGVRTG
jgi:hypothetical protein